MAQLGLDLGKSATTEKLLDATAAGVFRKAKLFTRDLLSQRHFTYAVRLQAPPSSGEQPAVGVAQTAAAEATHEANAETEATEFWLLEKSVSQVFSHVYYLSPPMAQINKRRL